MKFHISFLLALLFFQCDTKTKDKTNIQNPSKKNKDVEHVKSNIPKYNITNHVITQENAIDFLTWYGQQNSKTDFVIETSLGNIQIKLFNETPINRANFAYLVEKKYFPTTYFHRVVKDFVIQAGNSDLMKSSNARKSIGKFLLPPEFHPNLKHEYGAIASAREWEDNPDKLTEPYEFYIVTKPNGAHHLNTEHTVFGKVTKGWDVVQKINDQEVDGREFPLVDVKILSVKAL